MMPRRHPLLSLPAPRGATFLPIMVVRRPEQAVRFAYACCARHLHQRSEKLAQVHPGVEMRHLLGVTIEQ